jgi:hypothetical protein
MSDTDTGGTGVEQGASLTDKLSVVGLDSTDWGDLERRETTVDIEFLKQGLELVETLGWEKVDICLVDPPNGTDDSKPDNPLLALRPDDPFFGDYDNAAVVVAPISGSGQVSTDD